MTRRPEAYVTSPVSDDCFEFVLPVFGNRIHARKTLLERIGSPKTHADQALTPIPSVCRVIEEFAQPNMTLNAAYKDVCVFSDPSTAAAADLGIFR